ncbi:hypothetical protein [Legionella sp.]|uniref:hypothetical protein n=1 Tax=Legionella sp. TaxID=459 RepID=UPI003CA495FE
MKNRNLAILGISLTVTALSCSSVYAKKIYPAELVGRDLDIPIGKNLVMSGLLIIQCGTHQG